MNDKKTYLFLLTISPVQSFIAQARKTQDLYTGSKILTELTKIGIETIGRNNIVFPFSKYANDADWKAIKSLPNRFVAELSGTENEINQLGINAEKSIRDEFRSISQKALSNAGIKSFLAYEQQIEQHLEIYWAAIELSNDYKATYAKLEQLIGSLKNIRQFSQYSYDGIGEKGRKCSIDGERNAIIYRSNVKTDGSKSKPFALHSEAKETTHKLEEGEALSAVSYTKRAYKEGGFPSTSSIALMHVHNVMKDPKVAGLCYTLIKETNDQLFYKENIESKKYLEKAIREANGKSNLSPNSIIDCHKSFWEIADKQGFAGSSKHKYFAVLTFDGDSMGKWLGGENVDGDLKAFHNDFSKALSDFAKTASSIIKKDVKGHTVYAGGDDYLGFVNINHLFDVLAELQVAYKKEVSDSLLKYRKDDKEITFSAGICIAHYKEPLRLVLQEAHSMMDKAKDAHDDKNCFGISVIKGSGETLETVWKNDVIDTLKEITIGLIDKEYKEDKNKKIYFSDKYIKVLETEFERLANEQNKLDNNDLLKAELHRTLKRAVNNGEKKEKEAAVKAMEIAILKLYAANTAINEDMTNFFSALNFCRFMQRELCKKTFFELKSNDK